jgi:hypothetical protein
MADLKEQQTGAAGDNFTVGGNLAVTGTATVTGTSTFTGVSTFTAAPVVPSTFGIVPAGGIIMWSGTIAAIPTGWYLCNGSNGTPDLRNQFVVGAYSDDAGVAKTTITGSATKTGGSKDAITVSHTHTATVTDPGHKHTFPTRYDFTGGGSGFQSPYNGLGTNVNSDTTTVTTGISVTNSSTGSSGTNANLVPYYALAFIMKS